MKKKGKRDRGRQSLQHSDHFYKDEYTFVLMKHCVGNSIVPHMTMENVKQWFVSKCKEASSQLSGLNTSREQSPVRKHSHMMTPWTIPEFTIPGTIDTSASNSECDGSSPHGSGTSSPRQSPSPRGPSPALLNPSPTHDLRSKSCPVSPSKPPQILLQNHESFSTGCLETAGDTNADPLSLAAVSLPHFRTKTGFGFSTVSEVPHTRRKESLFHAPSSSPGSPLLSRHRRKQNSVEGSNTLQIGAPKLHKEKTYNDDSLDICPGGYRRPRRRHISTMVSPLGVFHPVRRRGSNGSESPGGSPVHGSPGDSPVATPDICKIQLSRYLSDIEMLKTEHLQKKRYHRRRSSLSTEEVSDTSVGDSSVTDECSSAEPSPNFRRRSNGTIEPIHVPKRYSNPVLGNRPKPPSFSSGKIPKSKSLNSGLTYLEDTACRSSVDMQDSKDSELTSRGEIKLSMRYLENEGKLLVSVIKAENLGGADRNEYSVSPYLKLCLMPGKIQKQSSCVFKHTKDPLFLHDFTFEKLTLEELSRMRVRIKVCSKGHNIVGDEFLGETQLLLMNYNLEHESRMWRNLEAKSDTMDLGNIEVGICFEPKYERLKISIHRVKGLQKHYITGPPDPYVKIKVSQPGRQEIKRQTRVRKNTINPEFEEQFTFIISPRVEDLNYTSLTLIVMNHETIRSDEVIGQVRFGFQASEDTELNHWQEILYFPGKDFTHWHTLMEV